MKSILVTGGAGFIGSHTCLELIKKGYKLILIDNLENSNLDVIDKIKYISGTGDNLETRNGDRVLSTTMVICKNRR